MRQVIASYNSLIWLLLVSLTGLSWFLGEHNAAPAAEHIAWFTTAMMLVGFFKVRLVGLDFMELRHSPWFLRIIFEAWVLITCAIILVLYWM